jgi:hypothetical protein
MNVEWFDPATGMAFRHAPAMGGEPRSFKAPFRGDAVLFLDQKRGG